MTTSSSSLQVLFYQYEDILNEYQEATLRERMAKRNMDNILNEIHNKLKEEKLGELCENCCCVIPHRTTTSSHRGEDGRYSCQKIYPDLTTMQGHILDQLGALLLNTEGTNETPSKRMVVEIRYQDGGALETNPPIYRRVELVFNDGTREQKHRVHARDVIELFIEHKLPVPEDLKKYAPSKRVVDIIYDDEGVVETNPVMFCEVLLVFSDGTRELVGRDMEPKEVLAVFQRYNLPIPNHLKRELGDDDDDMNE